MHNSSATHADNLMDFSTTTASPVLSNVGYPETEHGDEDIDLEIRIIYGIAGTAVVALLALFGIYLLTRFVKKRAPADGIRSNRSDTMSIDSWVIVCDDVPEVLPSQEKTGTSFSPDDNVDSSPPLQRATERTGEPSFAGPSLSRSDRLGPSHAIISVFGVVTERVVDGTAYRAAVG